MFDCLAHGNSIYLQSKFWEALNEKNLEQLESRGIANFKQTVAQNYFTWVIGRRETQFRYIYKIMACKPQSGRRCNDYA